MNVGSLFSGIGGFDLGFERAGMRTMWQVEQSDFCRRVLERHFPDAERHIDVRDVGVHNLEPVELICGGFPCQDISVAGRGAGIEGDRSGLWSEYARVVGELRPRYVVVENVSALLARGLERVLGDLAALGYDAEWDCLPASAFGAPHRRDRLWLVAYPGGERRRQNAGSAHGNEAAHEGRAAQHDHVADRDGQGGRAGHVADPDSSGPQGHGRPVERAGELTPATGRSTSREGTQLADPDTSAGRATRGAARSGAVERSGRRGSGFGEPWAVEPDVGRVANGVPNRVDRLAALGNALVPQIAEWIGRRILEHEEGRVAA